MGNLRNLIETERGHGFVAVRFGREDGPYPELVVTWWTGHLDVGFGIWPNLGQASLSLGLLSITFTLYRPYRPTATIVAGEPETEEARARREERERCCLLMEEIELAMGDMSVAELERIAAIIEAAREEEPHA
jgi:hypothetical protein